MILLRMHAVTRLIPCFPRFFARCIAFHLVFIYLCRFLFRRRSSINWPKQCICWTRGIMHWVYVDNSVWWLLGWSRCQCFVQSAGTLTIWYVVCSWVNNMVGLKWAKCCTCHFVIDMVFKYSVYEVVYWFGLFLVTSFISFIRSYFTKWGRYKSFSGIVHIRTYPMSIIILAPLEIPPPPLLSTHEEASLEYNSDIK